MKLVGEELDLFIETYFKAWGKDIISVSYIDCKDRIEYLVNGHYLFVVKKKKA